MSRKRLGLYLHYPFCIKKCHYCDFLSFVMSDHVRLKYREALLRELGAQKELAAGYMVDSVFIGGGTPSLLKGCEMEEIVKGLRKYYMLEEDCEFTVECNPGTVTVDKLRAYRDCGVNRLSFGLQSACREELRGLGRIHSYDDFLRSYELAWNIGFTNINVDLMSGIPCQTRESFWKTCRKVLALRPTHISAYSLIIEEGTPFYKEYSEKPPIDEETDRQMYADTKRILSKAGFSRYEISNYARPGYECRHNLKYWSGEDYLGFGLGAASRMGDIHFSNEREFESYFANPGKREEDRHLSQQEQMEEFMFLGLRKCEGIKISEFKARFQKSLMDEYGDIICKYIKLGMMVRDQDTLSLSEPGIDVSNVILADFIK